MNENWSLLVYLPFICTAPSRGKSHTGFLDCIEAPESITNIRSSVSLHIFSPNSTLLCWYKLVVRFPQVFLLKTARRRISLMRFTFLDNASRLPFSFPNSVLYQVHPQNFRCVPPKRSIPILQLSVEFMGSESWTFFQNSN